MPRTTKSPENSTASIYRRLRAVGLTKPYVQNVVLPDWWDDSLAANPAGRAQFLMILSRHLGLDLMSLQKPEVPLRLQDFGVCKYKKRKGTTDDDLQLSRVIATRAAQIAGAAVEGEYQPISSRASEVRQWILENSPWVGFDELLAYCWSLNIPVLHVNFFPPGAKRADGFTLHLHGRPVIVLCRNEKQPSWLLFVLAHELGHIACGHVPEDGSLIDERVKENEVDAEETEADQYALEILTGKPTTTIGVNARWPNARALADNAKLLGRRAGIDPGHVVLNYAHNMGPNFFAVGRAALKLLFPNADAMATVRTKLAENLNWELLPEDSSDFLIRITRQSQESDE